LHTIGIAIGSGIITGVILPLVLPSVLGKDQHEDASAWEVHDGYYRDDEDHKAAADKAEHANQKWRESQEGNVKLDQVVMDSKKHDEANFQATSV
jgi:hypothetical protein